MKPMPPMAMPPRKPNAGLPMSTAKTRKTPTPTMPASTSFMPRKSTLRRSPGLPAMSRRFSVRLTLDGLAKRCATPERPLGHRAQGALEERLLELDLLQRPGLHRAQLRQARLDRIHWP